MTRGLSARNRELLALVPVALLITAGFAAVFITRKAEISDVSLTYGAYFLVLCLAAHIFLRFRLPNADPYLFPLCALLAAIGLVVIFRIDDELAFDQATVFVLGLALFCATILFLRDYHVLERYRYVIATVGILLLLAPRLFSPTNGAYLTVDIGPPDLPAVGDLEALHRHLPRQLSRREARAALGRRAPLHRPDDPAAQALRADARRLGSRRC